MKVAFLMSNPFTLGGEQRVVSVISNLLYKKGLDITILCTDINTNINRKLYNLDNNIKIEKFERSKGIYKYTFAWTKIPKFFIEKLNLFNNNIKLLEFVYYKKMINMNRELIQIINKNDYDYVVGVGGFYSMLLAINKDKIKSKIIGWQHSCFDSYFNLKKHYYYNQKSIFKKNIKNLDNYIVLTDSDKKDIDKYFGIKSIKINNPKSFISEKPSLLNKKNFLLAGRFVDAKGIDLLLESYKIFCEKNHDWNLTIVGDGPDKKKIIKIIKKYNLENRVFIKPFTKDIISYYKNSSIYLLSSRWEGFAMVLLECLEMGLPIISYDLPCTREAINNGKNGYIVNNYDTKEYAKKMLYLASNDDLIKTMGNNSRLKCNKFDEKNIIEKWLKVFK